MEENAIDCPRRDETNIYCSCPKTDCSRHGLCCQCILAHKQRPDSPLSKRFPHCLRDLLGEVTPQ
jgi:hypothetical protein